jgi:hypothetical protein
MRRCLLATLSIAAACGGSPSPTPASGGPGLSIVAPRASEADVEVAKVNGRPVWGSCVAAQLARGAADRRAALDECVSFELLAQAAEKRGLATETEVVEATRTAMVNRLVASQFEERYKAPGDLGPAMDRWLEKNAWRMHRPELRASSYARIRVRANAPPETEAKAKQIAEAVATELAGETGLFGAHVKDAAQRHLAGTGLELESQDLPPVPVTKNYEKPYLDALFSISEVGRIAKPVRTTRGWDVILWSGGLPPKETTRDELAADVFPDLLRAQFAVWISELVKINSVSIKLDQGAIARLDEVVP